jgi:hypothetical protein
LLVSVVAGLGRAQESRGQNAATPAVSSTSTAVKKAVSPGERVILKVGDLQVTQAEFEASIGDIEPQADPDKEGEVEKDRRRMGDDYASVLMLSHQAVANHLDSTPEVKRQLMIDRLQILSDAQFASLLRQCAPTADEISHYYSAHLSDYDRVRIRRLFIWKTGAGSGNSRGLAPEVARARADAILQASLSGGDPKKLVEEFKGSEVGLLDAEPIPFRRGELPAKIEKVAFGLKVGDWAEADETPASIMVLQLVQRDRQTLGEVMSLIEQRLQGEEMQAKLQDLKKRAGIWMDEEYFGRAVADAPGAQPSGANPQPSKLRKSAVKKEETTQ